MDSGAVLVADDDADIRRLLVLFLTLHGYRVSVAEDGQEALQLLEHVQPSFIVSDLLMPNVNGLELCRRVRSDPRFSGVPIVLFTAIGRSAEIDRAMELRGVHHVVKTEGPRRLLEVVGALEGHSPAA
jgi:CheY-like chemotaxis protein